jgi:hypothetical protein
VLNSEGESFIMSLPENLEGLGHPLRGDLFRSVVFLLVVGLVIAPGTPSVSGAAEQIPKLEATSDEVTPKAAVDLIKQSYGKPLTVDELRELRGRLEILGEGTVSIGTKPRATRERRLPSRTRCVATCCCGFSTDDGRVRRVLCFGWHCGEPCPVCAPPGPEGQEAPSP